MPKLDEFTITIIIIALPGIISFFLLSKLIGSCGRNLLEKILLILLFSILSYSLYFWLLISYYPDSAKIFFSDEVFKLTNFSNNIRIIDIFYSSLAAIIITLVLSYAYNFNLFNKFAQFIKSTKRYGDEDLWYYFHKTYAVKKGEWFIVRDQKNDLAYYGYISAYSETNENRELLMFKVDVYTNSNADFLYSTDHIYLSFNNDDISIEIIPFEKKKKQNEKSN